MKRRAISLLVLAVIVGASCGQFRYEYKPVTTTSAQIEGHSAAIAPIPPKGELRLASLGIVGAPPAQAVFVRFVIDNQSREEWTFDEAEQRIELQERDQRVMRWAGLANGARPPILRVPPMTASSVDVLFPVGDHDAGDVARFDVLWTVHAGANVVTGHAGFARHLTTREPAPAAFEPVMP